MRVLSTTLILLTPAPVYSQDWKDLFNGKNLDVEYWIPPHGNSGVSIRDVSHGHYVIGGPDTDKYANATKLRGSPAHIGYEIQILDGDSDRYPSGSVYLFAAAKKGVQKPQDR